MPEVHRGHRALRYARVSLAKHIYHVTTTTHERQKLFADFEIARVAVRNLNDPQIWADHELFAWVLDA